MKKLFIILMLFVSVQSFAQQGIKYTVDTIEFTKRIDSTTVNTYTKLSADWETGGFSDAWFTGGQYTMYVYIDSCKNSSNVWIDSVLVGDTDSLFIYVKARVPTVTAISVLGIRSYEVCNDSLFITPLSTTTGFDFALDKWYLWDFELPRCRGVDFFVKRQSSVGGLTYRFVITK